MEDNKFLDGQITFEQFFSPDAKGNENNEVRITKPIRLIEMFAGYGSQALAFKYLGFPIEHHFVCEFDKYAIKSYNAVHGTDYPTIDITNVKGSDLNITESDKYVYMLTYSFPCTDLSVAGKQAGMSKGSGTRSGLLWEVERILQEIVNGNGELPQILFMENVPQVHGKKNIDDFNTWIEFLDGLGYVSTWKDLNAKNFGVPQNRNRTFMFSFLKSEFGEKPVYEFPKEIELDRVMDDVLEDETEVDEKYYVNNERADKLIADLIAKEQLP